MATVEDVKEAIDSKETARNTAQIVRALAVALDSIERDQMHRRFYPELDTRTFDWPSHVDPHDGSRTLSLERDEIVSDELVSYTQIKVAGVVIGSTHITLLPANTGPPYTGVEFDSTVTNPGNARRAVEIIGLFGYRSVEEQVGTLAANLAAGAAATASVSWTTARFGVGDVLRIDNERLIIKNRTMVDSTQNLGGTGLTDKASNVTVPVANGTGFATGEIILIDSERMLIVDVAGNNLTVRRAWDGSVLATHAASTDIFTLTGVELARGQFGTTDATHNTNSAIYRQVLPPLIDSLHIAEAITVIQQENAAYGRVIGSGDAQRDAAGTGLEDLRERAYKAHGRKVF